jgi:RNA polymerase sigma-70 factor (ECF subfamily)
LDYNDLDDQALLRLIIHSRQEALSTLYDRYGRLVFSLALSVVGDYPTAEEVTQDVFLRVWEKAETYQADQSQVSTWLTSITRYRAIDILRRRGSRPEKDSIAWEDLPAGAEPAEVDDPEELAAQNFERNRVRVALAALPPEQQKALSLAYFKGLSHSEIAEVLGDPLGTVKTRIRLGMQKLREYLADDLSIRK